MALPVGVTTATVTVGVPVSFVGGPVRSEVAIRPSVFLIHTATGTPLVDFLETSSTSEGVAGQFTLPHTDQAGFQDENGNAYTNWYYTATIQYFNAKTSSPPKSKVFQIPTGQDAIDIDLLPGGAAALPFTAPAAGMLSFQGRTGAVTLQESDLPERLAEAELSATIITQITDDIAAPEGIIPTAILEQTVAPIAAAVDPINDNRASRDARTLAARFDLATDTLTAVTNSGLTTTGGYVAATVEGTDGNAIYPVWGTKNVRGSFRLKVTKATASSKSAVGFTVSTPGTLPTVGNFMFGVGYLAGTGICFVRDNVGAAIVIVADSALADGEEYDIGFMVDTTLSARGGTSGNIAARVRTTAGVDTAFAGTTFNLASFPVNNMLIRTNVAAGSITNLKLSLHPVGQTGVISAAELPYSTVSPTEKIFLHVPPTPNGKLVIACHGHGGTPTETGWTSATYKDTWKVLTDAGFTVAVPNMGGNLWGNNTAQAYLAELQAQLVAQYGLDPDVFLWGNSMGGGASLTAIAKNTLPVKAAYLAQPVCDLAVLWANPSFTTLPAAYNDSTVERDANNPMTQAAADFAGVPMLFVASAADTTVSKTAHTDAMRTKLGSVTPNYLFTATGNHNDPAMFRPRDTLEFFRANMG